MKKVAIIYRNTNNQEVINYLKNRLENIFSNYIQVENHYLTELKEDEVIEADAYILIEDKMLYSLKGNIKNHSNIIFMSRSLQSKHLNSVKRIPKDTNVLIVNDSYESSVDVLCALYELGINHLNFVPFDPSDIDNPSYKKCRICVTTNEMHLVPSYIERVINLGYRDMSFDTLIRLMDRLDLNFDLTNRNLVRHIRSISEPDMFFYENYSNSFIKNYVLKSVIEYTKSALIITNEKYQLLFSNDKAKKLFNIENKISSVSLSSLINEDNFKIMEKEAALKTSIEHNKTQFYIEKTPIMLLDEVMGYSITFQNEKDLIDREISASKLLQKRGLYAKYTFDDIVHDSPAMSECIKKAKTVALTDNTVLITGESGTGKELLAQSMHNYSNRKNKSFVALNCAAIPESLLESELFGYEKGSFTGAKSSGKPGLFEQANGGTIFLDEIGDISADLQARLLRVLQERQVMRLGSERVINIDTRIIAATNKDLAREVEMGNFRKDLYYRLNVITIFIESLKNRKEDILPIMAGFLGEKYNQLTNYDKEILHKYDWPGNVRELENAAIHFTTLSRLPDYILESFNAAYDSGKAINLSAEDIEREILRIIKENTQPYHGIGRNQINKHLKTIGISIGDSNLREILHHLQGQGLISIGRGRSGTKITEFGLETINGNLA